MEVTSRPTPTPGPNEILVEVKSIALNPVDYYQRDMGFLISSYPAVLGSDVAGTVIATGSSVDAKLFKEGTRVASFASSFYKGGDPNYGALQARVIVAASATVPLPEKISFNEGSLLPMAVATAWAGWWSSDLAARGTKNTAADKQGLLVWGGASSVGSGAIQLAKSMGFVVYTTASEKHHAYLKTIGASRAFDYKEEGVVAEIIKAANEDGLAIATGYNAVIGGLEPSMEVLKELKGAKTAKLASAPSLSEDYLKVEGVAVKFVSPPADEKERDEHFTFVFNVWLTEKLNNGEYVPSPKVKVMEGGLQGANKALDELAKGVSGEKLVLEV